MLRETFVYGIVHEITQIVNQSGGYYRNEYLYHGDVVSITATNTLFGTEFVVVGKNGQENRNFVRSTYTFTTFLGIVERAIQTQASQYGHPINTGAGYRISLTFNPSSTMLEIDVLIHDANAPNGFYRFMVR